MFVLETIWREVGAGNWPSMMFCLFTGSKLPDFCAAMSREPQPDTGTEFGLNFLDVYARALALNAAVHDGAIMVGRCNPAEPYSIKGWSYRLFPPASTQITETNRGSAFNSCLEMSKVPSVDTTYLVSEGRLHRFIKGSVTPIHF
ncbi:MAG: hypothetical protein ACK5BF_08085 [Hyphomonadaceae bacterium]|jgi:hypothetical protein|nr:hypothetical protein [Hyphomonadaceae bacterium]MCZ8195552.1 hypothetical protein [Aquidulcibacter sp.]